MLRKAFFTLTIAAGFLVGMTACGGGSDHDAGHDETEAHVDEATHDEHEGHNHDAENTEMAEATYYCPMECEGDKTYAETGSCAVCGMDLVVKQ